MVLSRPEERETCPYHCSLRLLTFVHEVFVWSDCLLDLPMAYILPWSSAVRVHDSQAYRKMDVTKERISRILELRDILLSFQTGFDLVTLKSKTAIQELLCSLT